MKTSIKQLAMAMTLATFATPMVAKDMDGLLGGGRMEGVED